MSERRVPKMGEREGGRKIQQSIVKWEDRVVASWGGEEGRAIGSAEALGRCILPRTCDGIADRDVDDVAETIPFRRRRRTIHRRPPPSWPWPRGKGSGGFLSTMFGGMGGHGDRGRGRRRLLVVVVVVRRPSSCRSRV